MPLLISETADGVDTSSRSIWPPTSPSMASPALVGDVGQLDVCRELEGLGREVRRAALAAGAVVEPLRMRLRVGQQVAERLERRGGRNGDQHRGKDTHRDRRERARVIPREFLEHVRQDRIGVVVRQQGVAVRCGAGDELGADAAGRAGLVLDVERLAHLLGELLGDLVGRYRRRAGSVRHDDADGLVGYGAWAAADWTRPMAATAASAHGLSFMACSSSFRCIRVSPCRTSCPRLRVGTASSAMPQGEAAESCQCGWGSASSSAASTLRAAAVPMLT